MTRYIQNKIAGIFLCWTISTMALLIGLLQLDSGHFSVLLFQFFAFIFSFLLIRNIVKVGSLDAIYLFSIAYCVYTLYMILTNSIYVKNPFNDFFIYSDQSTYYTVSELIGNSNTIRDMLSQAIAYNIAVEGLINIGAFLYFGFVAFLSNLIDGNSIILQKLIIIFISSFNIVYIYKILKYNFSFKFSFKFTFIFIFFSFIFFHSSFLLRDMIIALFYAIGISIMQESYSKKGLLKLFLLAFLCYLFRPMNGAFFFLYIFIYTYEKNNVYTRTLIAILGVSFVGYILVNIELISDFQSRLNNSYNYSLSRSEGSIRGMLYKLPIGIQQIGLFVYSQIQPFPNYGLLFASSEYPSYERNLFRLPESLAALYWMYIWTLIIILYAYKRRFLRAIPKIQKYLFYAAVLLILLNTVEVVIRRTMIVYPSIYLIALYLVKNSTREEMNKYTQLFVMIYIALHFLYLLIRLI